MRPSGHGGRGHGEPVIFGQFHIFGEFTKDHLADLSRLLGLVHALSMMESNGLAGSTTVLESSPSSLTATTS